MIKAIISRNPGLISRNASGTMTGYAVISSLKGVWRLGSLMASDESSARNLTVCAMERTAGRIEVACTAAPGHPAHALYRELGFTATPDRAMMELGPNTTPDDFSYATTSYLAT